MGAVDDGVGVVEVDVGIDNEEEEEEEEVEKAEEAERVTGKEGKDNVGCTDAILQNCCPRVSIVVTWSGQLPSTQLTISAG